MVDDAQNRIQGAMTSMVDDIDKSYLRGMQRSMHLCAAKCCEQKEVSVDKVHHCIENCSSPLHSAQSYVQTELSQFQERLQRCIMVCQDRVREKVTSNTTEAQANIFKGEFEACAMTCVDDHIKLMPSTKSRIAEALKKKS